MSSDPVVEAAARIFGDLGAVAERLRAERDAASLRPAALRSGRERAVARGIDGLAKVAGGRAHDLSADERFGIEAIILLEGRPALAIRDGDFGSPPHEWSRLGDRRAAIRAAIARCGRIEVAGHATLRWLGTAFLVAPATLMTNRHVAHAFSRRDRERWVYRPGMSTRIDFLGELGSSAALEFEIAGSVGVHDDHDLALLRVEPVSREGPALPGPLAVAATAPADALARDVYLVGYPGRDSGRNDPERMRQIFADVYDVKRLQPGRTVGYSTRYGAVEHDCSTLGGNSGSPLFDLETDRVVGLHFGGRYGTANYAVPLWTLSDDPLLTRAGVNFR